MRLQLLVLLPAAAGLLALLLRRDRPRRALLPAVALVHSGLVLSVWIAPPAPAWRGWLALDALGQLFLSITSALFLAVAFYAVGYLAREQHGERTDFQEGLLFSNAPEAVFVGCLLFFLATMTYVTACPHFGLQWVGIEATTLTSAPLIYFHRHRRSLEAAWKYLMICSVGIAVALLGFLFLSVAADSDASGPHSMLLADLLQRAPDLHPEWLRAAFILLLVGYGTKMGLAPLHTWLPDAHSEAPSVVSALLSGALLNCAFLGILRALQVCLAAGLGDFARGLLLGFGIASMAVAAVFLVGQRDYKRMLAYSSVEHMGILALGVGLGGAAPFAAALHAVNHSLVKGMLFLVAGNILATYRTKSSQEVRGVLRLLPASGAFWVLGLFAITGSPPFGPFWSEFGILKAALDQGRDGIAAATLVLLAIIFAGMSATMLRMAQGAPAPLAAAPPQFGVPDARAGPAASGRESRWAIAPVGVLALAVLGLGLAVPPPLQALLRAVAQALGGS
jgi:hydrogenase-4 component F